MQFLAPWFGLFFLFIPIVLLFYLLKQKKQPLTVSSSLLWQQALADTVSQTPWQKLRKSLLLLLQLLLILLLGLALLRPYLINSRAGGRDLIILLDTSASMAALEQGGTRLDLAKAEIDNLVKSEKGGVRFSLIAVGNSPQVLVTQTTNASEILTGLKSVKPGFYQANLDTALALVTALQDKDSSSQVLFFSDGGVLMPDAPVGLADFQYRRVGSREDNLAIGSFSIGQGSGEPLALTRIDNYGSSEVEATVKLLAGGDLIDAQDVKVGAGKPAYLFWQVPDSAPYLEARLEVSDAFDPDNSAWLVNRQAGKAKALLVTAGNVFLEQALKLNPFLEVIKSSPAEYGEVKDQFDLYVYDGFWPEALPPGQFLAVNPPVSSGLLASDEEKVEKLQGGTELTLLQNVSWADVHVAKSKGVKAPAGWQTLLSDGDRTLMTAGKMGPSRIAVLGFDLHFSDLPLRPAFPILMRNLETWLLPAGGLRETQVSTGESVDLNLSADAQAAYMYKPDGSKLPLALSQLKFSDTQNPGLYKLEQTVNGQKSADFLAVNFFLAQESQIKPMAQIKLGMKEVSAGAPPKITWEFWPYLALLVLAVLAGEWWVYLRGH